MKEAPMKVSDAGNVIIPAYLTLQDKGYVVEQIFDESVDGITVWRATKGIDEFNASDPLTLLGVVAMVEHRGEAWQADTEEALPFMNKYL
jgi:hypothetical protein